MKARLSAYSPEIDVKFSHFDAGEDRGILTIGGNSATQFQLHIPSDLAKKLSEVCNAVLKEHEELENE